MSLSCLICFAPVTEEFTACHDCTQWIAELGNAAGSVVLRAARDLN